MARMTFLALAALCWSISAAGGSLEGNASVIDGDTIEIHGQRIRLFGIDAPESLQTCEAGGQAWRCGQQAALALAEFIDQRYVTCGQRDVDRYGRIVAVCRAGLEDLGAWAVHNGWALAYRRYSKAYVAAEHSAKFFRRGIWRGTFTAPWDWRRGVRSPY